MQRQPLSTCTATNSLSSSHPLSHSCTRTLCPRGDEPTRLPGWSDGETRILALSFRLCVSLSFSLSFTDTHFTSTCPRLWLPPTHSTSESRAATSYRGLSINSNQYQLIGSCLCVRETERVCVCYCVGDRQELKQAENEVFYIKK